MCEELLTILTNEKFNKDMLTSTFIDVLIWIKNYWINDTTWALMYGCLNFCVDWYLLTAQGWNVNICNNKDKKSLCCNKFLQEAV